MNLAAIFGAVVILLLLAILWRVWRDVSSPQALDLQKQMELKEQFKEEVAALKEEWSRRLGEEVGRVNNEMQGQVRTSEQSVSQKLQQANDAVAKVEHKLGQLEEATKRVEEVGRNVSSLQDLLRAPKMRGGVGEYFLAELLAQILPPGGEFYSLQHEFSDGERVDAVIRLDRMVPVDSKFPLDNFRKMGQAATDEERSAWRRTFARDVKKHIDDIAEKYIRPAEGTYDFALMYIPAENVYYETIIKEEGVSDGKGLFQHALSRRVIPVSPNSFYAYLQVILQGLRGFAVEQRAKEILGELMRLQRELAGVREDFDRDGKQLGFTVENFEKAEKHLARFEGRLDAIEPGQGAAGELMAPTREALSE